MTHDFVLQTFIVYLFVKALIFLPLAWVAILFWWSDRSSSETVTVETPALDQAA